MIQLERRVLFASTRVSIDKSGRDLNSSRACTIYFCTPSDCPNPGPGIKISRPAILACEVEGRFRHLRGLAHPHRRPHTRWRSRAASLPVAGRVAKLVCVAAAAAWPVGGGICPARDPYQPVGPRARAQRAALAPGASSVFGDLVHLTSVHSLAACAGSARVARL